MVVQRLHVVRIVNLLYDVRNFSSTRYVFIHYSIILQYYVHEILPYYLKYEFVQEQLHLINTIFF